MSEGIVKPLKQLLYIVKRGMRVAQPMCLILLNSHFVRYKIQYLYY